MEMLFPLVADSIILPLRMLIANCSTQMYLWLRSEDLFQARKINIFSSFSKPSKPSMLIPPPPNPVELFGLQLIVILLVEFFSLIHSATFHD